jgi:protein TonB
MLFSLGMASACAGSRSLLILVMLVMWTASAHAQDATPDASPAPPHVEVEVKPPDEPSSQGAPEVEAPPEASPSPEALENDQGEPIPADRVAHPPEIETYVVPEYPKKARAQRIEGRVLLMVIVDESGKVEDDVKVEDSIPMLDAAAIDAVHRWSFTPARDSTGTPVRVQLEVPVRFTLR